MENITSLQYYLWLLGMTPSFVIYIWPITLPLLCVSVFIAIKWYRKSPKAHIKWSYILSLSFSLVVFILLYGTLFRAGETPPPDNNLPTTIVLTTLAVQLFAIFYMIHKAEIGAKLLTVVTLLWGFLFSFSASFISIMSVTGDWL